MNGVSGASERLHLVGASTLKDETHPRRQKCSSSRVVLLFHEDWRRVKAKLQLRSCKPLICRVSSVVEQRFCKPLARGSNPLPGTNKINRLNQIFLSQSSQESPRGRLREDSGPVRSAR